ncbi:hypothetical protein BDV34DRAFT_227101 [Aspergillus parasiticus]|uniref:Uncharacterized protein n=1 Tax=Aspergillus parasiticus TaxID=5067 RepID=A0A5N6DH87_ASPPA|nr:hypothetical protein BDV34DRAFT_227101 [Aspergillus parasiticus]
MPGGGGILSFVLIPTVDLSIMVRDLLSRSVRRSRSHSQHGSIDGNDSSIPLCDFDSHGDGESNNSSRASSRSRHASDNEDRLTNAKTAKWSPYTLSLPFLATLSVVAFGLCLTTFLLWWRSSINYGLGSDDGSSALLFGWRYTPTLIAVLYVQMTAVLLVDIKRTEPYARLARPHGAEASTSILKAPGAWWNALYDGFAKRKNGSRSWTLIGAALLNILGFMLISPLSSVFLFSESVVVPKATEFLRLSPRDSPLPIQLDRVANFRTIANLVQNTSTSPWITDQYTFLPFWPADMQSAPIASLPTSLSQKWETETTVFKSNFSCTTMSVASQQIGTMEIPEGAEQTTLAASFLWSSSDGCEYGMATGIEIFEYGCSSWSNTSTFYNAKGGSAVHGTDVSTNQTAACKGKEVIFVTDAWKLRGESENADGTQYSNSKGARIQAQLCDAKYYMANVSTSVYLGGNEAEIWFDENEFEKRKVAIPSSHLNITQFSDMMLDSDWINYMSSLYHPLNYEEQGYEQQGSILGGPSILLGGLYNYNMTLFASDPDLAHSASRTKQRYLGEVLQSALTQQGASQKTSVQGHVYSIETRVVVQSAPAIALGVLFFFSFLLILAIWWHSQQHQRPLNLQEDPATTIGVAYLLTHDKQSTSIFHNLRQPTDKELYRALKGEWFYTNSDGLAPVNTADNDRSRPISQSENGAPRIFRLPLLLTFVIILILVVVGVAVLYHFSLTTALYEKAFVYDFQVSFFGNSLSSVAPFAIIPTVVALIIGLWWGAMDDIFRHLQPFLAMSKDTQPFSKGAALSYQSTFWVWACLRALHNKHWLLALVTLGSTFSAIFTTTMSALFERGPQVFSQSVTLNRSLEIRSIPHVISVESNKNEIDWNYAANEFLTDLFYNVSNNWIYSATIQLSLNKTQQPAWSKDGWAFVPVGTNALSDMDLQPDLDESNENVDGAAVNVSLTTPALRGRIECSQAPVQAFANLSNWLTPKDLTNHTYWDNATIPPDLEKGYKLGQTRTYPSYSWMPALARWIVPLTSPEKNTSCPGCTTVLSNPEEIACCANGSSSDWKSSSAVGYWSPNTTPDTFSWASWERNFTVKWIQGDTVSGIRSRGLNSRGQYEDLNLLFVRPPSITLLTCKPIIESTTANISVNPVNGEIQEFSLVDKPTELSSAFTDNFLPHIQNGTSSGAKSCNATLSLGRLFMISLLSAAKLNHVTSGSSPNYFTVEDLYDNTFNILDKNNGLNMDFMSYSMYTMANKNPYALLDPVTLNTLAEKTFTTFFQHFASNNVSLETGSWSFQKINASLPADLGIAVKINNSVLTNESATQQDVIHPISHTNRIAQVNVSSRVEVLKMNSVAVWLSISIMGWLILTTAVVAIFQKRYFGTLVRGVECLGDVLLLIANSPNLLQVVAHLQSEPLTEDAYKRLQTRLAWFIDGDGKLRWGIEMEGHFGSGPGTQWVSAPRFSKKEDFGEWTCSDHEGPS